MQKLLIIDNYDSFTWNLYQYFSAMRTHVIVKKNDEISILEIEKMSPDKIIISPGPGTPENSGISLSLILNFYKKIPIFGVCLGHQAIALAFGAKIIRANKIMHGKKSLIIHNNKNLFHNLKNPLYVVRYHSLIIQSNTLPDHFIINAKNYLSHKNDQYEIMAIKHKQFPLYGVQFHPESILSDMGFELLYNFVKN
ncbi:aminodeoxychorismate synthase, subunit II [Wigglesworthia glossinidia endosymbiont of Glossina morsitans morsitans (Yale colony)]|uniref:Aminodeoxychorismate synthase, subunit II n=1 Tax=Wigglesworthia glossinidia endosymbiont of Glossina morsitans morsitans (Yale colony) TaxID=1142511 RepID=H6Q4A7_WIGGL|nr:aminodeoxychorismate/anthranilate synthase component II [Wigglesworthia glossinidia]AFA40890.1 aminodeoxychorismate synthase, subunit II [Wigglesworthia glossinidia endosymbiont of Glossina morsitans morsitans (Yale colony)]